MTRFGWMSLIVVLGLASCKSKETESREPFFPILSFLKGQVADIDTSLYAIRKLVYVDSSRTDTSYIPREQFRAAANDFLAIPDLSEAKYQDRYQEQKSFDESINRVLLTYLPLKPDKEEIQRQEVLIKPDPSGDKVTNIIINTAVNTRDSSVQKKLMWKVGDSFQVITIKQLKGQPESISTVKVVWAEEE